MEDTLPHDLIGESTDRFSVAADESLGNEQDIIAALHSDPVDAALVIREQAPMFNTLALRGAAQCPATEVHMALRMTATLPNGDKVRPGMSCLECPD